MLQPSRFRTGDQALVREINLSLIMSRLIEHAALSRAGLAEATGLNKSTVSSLVQELIDHKFVRETGLASVGIGRPSMLLELNPSAGYIISGEIGVDFISVVCTDFAAQILWRHKENTRGEKDQRVILERAAALIREAVRAGEALCSDCNRLLGLAVGVPGLVDRTDGTLLFAPNLRWENVRLRDSLRESFSAGQLFIENEAYMAALGELFFGAAQGHDDVLFISAGVGLGGAMLREGHVFRGKTGFASEFGHMTMDPDGDLCNCGNRGCWETQVSQSAVFRHIRRAVEAGEPTGLLEAVGHRLDDLTMPLVVEVAHLGDPVALHALEQVGRHLGIGLASLVNALNPNLIVFSGILSLAGNFLLPMVETELQRRALRWNVDTTRVVIAQHGSDACVMGGVALVYQHIFSQPGLIMG